jgi:hypothetical protein
VPNEFDIKFFQMVLPADDLRVGHLWWTEKWKFPPNWFGEPDLEIAEEVNKAIKEFIYPRSIEFKTSTKKHGEDSAGLLLSLFKQLGVVGLDFNQASQLNINVSINVADLRVKQVAPALIARLSGRPVPPMLITGKYVVSHAQFMASQGEFKIEYDETQAESLDLKLNQLEGNGINHKSSSAGQILYSFKADGLLSFGISVLQIFEADRKFGVLGVKDIAFDFVKITG